MASFFSTQPDYAAAFRDGLEGWFTNALVTKKWRECQWMLEDTYAFPTLRGPIGSQYIGGHLALLQSLGLATEMALILANQPDITLSPAEGLVRRDGAKPPRKDN